MFKCTIAFDYFYLTAKVLSDLTDDSKILKMLKMMNGHTLCPVEEKSINQQTRSVYPVKTLKSWFFCQGCGSLVSVSHSAGALSYRSTEDSSLPEILLGLIYNSATGQLSAEVIKGSHFKTTASNKPVSEYNSLLPGLLGTTEWVFIDYFLSQHNFSFFLLIECKFPD